MDLCICSERKLLTYRNLNFGHIRVCSRCKDRHNTLASMYKIRLRCVLCTQRWLHMAKGCRVHVSQVQVELKKQDS